MALDITAKITCDMRGRTEEFWSSVVLTGSPTRQL